MKRKSLLVLLLTIFLLSIVGCSLFENEHSLQYRISAVNIKIDTIRKYINPETGITEYDIFIDSLWKDPVFINDSLYHQPPYVLQTLPEIIINYSLKNEHRYILIEEYYARVDYNSKRSKKFYKDTVITANDWFCE